MSRTIGVAVGALIVALFFAGLNSDAVTASVNQAPTSVASGR